MSDLTILVNDSNADIAITIDDHPSPYIATVPAAGPQGPQGPAGSGGGGSSAWADITGKPTDFAYTDVAQTFTQPQTINGVTVAADQAAVTVDTDSPPLALTSFYMDGPDPQPDTFTFEVVRVGVNQGEQTLRIKDSFGNVVAAFGGNNAIMSLGYDTPINVDILTHGRLFVAGPSANLAPVEVLRQPVSGIPGNFLEVQDNTGAILGRIATDGTLYKGTHAAIYDNNTALTDARTPLAHTQAFSTITGTPTTLTGYGITDAATSTALSTETTNRTNADALLLVKASNLSDLANAATARTNLGVVSASTTVEGLLSAADKARLDALVHPSDHNLLAWSWDPISGTTAAGTSGTIYYTKIKIAKAMTVSNIWVVVTTAGATLTAAQNICALYTVSGTTLTKVQTTADQSTAWTSTGAKSMAITATALTAGTIVYVGILAVGTTVPAFARGASSAAVSNVGLTTGTDPLRVASGATAQTTLPASVAYTTFGSNNSAPWIGLS